MNILILANTRCGGRYFTKYLSEKYNLKFEHEIQKKQLELKGLNNLCVKLLPWSYDEDYLVDLSKKFDYVFLLDRKNKEEQVQSLIVLLKVTEDDSVRWTWKNDYFKYNYDQYSELVKSRSEQLERIAKKINKSIIYYEDLYYDTEKVDLNGLEFKPDLNNKLRSNIKNKII